VGRKSGLIQLNVVTVTLAIVLAALVYGAWKFGPVYWQAHKVDNLMSGVKWEASKINMFRDDPRKQKLENRLRDGCLELGIDERFLDVYFSDDLTSVHADYDVVVDHPFGFSTTLEFERSEEIPRADMTN